MKSSIKIDFIDRGTGVGIEPVIRIELLQSEDPRDTLLSTLFQSIHYQQYLQLFYSHHDPQLNQKQILLFKPEISTDSLMFIVRSFCDWCQENGWSVNGIHLDDKGYQYVNKKKELKYDGELFKQFIEKRTTPQVEEVRVK